MPRESASFKNLLYYHDLKFSNTQESIGGFYMNRLAHTSWECKCDKVYKTIIYGKMKAEIGKILRQLCERKAIEMIAAQYCPDHVHILIGIPQCVRNSWIFERKKFSNYF